MGNSDYSEVIDEALEKTIHLVVIGSTVENISSGWIKAEWRFFLNQKRAGKKKGNILTVITKNLRIDDLPASLQNFEIISFENRLDKIWHYVRRKDEIYFGGKDKASEKENYNVKTEQLTVLDYANDLARKSKIALKEGDINEGFRLIEFAHRYANAYTPDIRKALIDTYNSNDYNSHFHLSCINSFHGHSDSINRIAYSPDGKYLGTSSSDHNVKIWNTESMEILMSLNDHSGSVWDIAYSPDGKHIATGSGDQTAKIWDAEIGRVLMTLTGHSNSIRGINFSQDGKYLATCSSDQTAKIWNMENGEIFIVLIGHSNSVEGISFSPDGKRVGTCSLDNTAKIWDADNGALLMTLMGHSHAIRSISFSPEGKLFATGSWDNTAKIWVVENGQLLMTLTGHTKGIKAINFSPDGKRLATGSNDGTVKIWEVESGELSITLSEHSAPITDIAFSPDEKHFATASKDGTAKIYKIEGTQLIQDWLDIDNKTELNLKQLRKYNLQDLLRLRPENESILISTKETWQIKAFADLAASEAEGSNILERVEPHFSRAGRLYAASLELQDEELIRMDYAKMLRSWAEVYQSNGQEEKAKELEEKADGLW